MCFPPHTSLSTPIPIFSSTNQVSKSQQSNAGPKPANVAAPARTAPAVSPNVSKPKTRPNAPRPINSSPSSRRRNCPKSISPCRGKWAVAGIARSGMPSVAMAARTSVSRLSSRGRRFGLRMRCSCSVSVRVYGELAGLAWPAVRIGRTRTSHLMTATVTTIVYRKSITTSKRFCIEAW